MKKRILGLLLAVSMLTGLLPTGALAAIGDITTAQWGGVDCIFEITAEDGTGTLTIQPTTGTPQTDPKTGQPYPVGAWKENVIYSGSTASAIGGVPYDSTKVTKLIIKEGVISIGSFVAQEMPATGELVIPSTVKYIGQETFSKSQFSSVIFAPNSQLETVAHGAFKYMTNLTEITFPASLKTLHMWQFLGCTNLKYVTILSCTYMQGGQHIDYYTNPNTEINPSWAGASGIVDGLHDDSLETVSFGSEAVRNLFFQNARNGNSADGIICYAGLTAYTDLQTALNTAATGDGRVVLVQNVTIPESTTVSIPAGVTLEVPQGKMLTNNGTILRAESGEIEGSGTFTNNGTYEKVPEPPAPQINVLVPQINVPDHRLPEYIEAEEVLDDVPDVDEGTEDRVLS